MSDISQHGNDEKRYSVTFLTEGLGGVYRWPDKNDTGDEIKRNEMVKITPLETKMGMRIAYTITDNDIKKASALSIIL